MPSLSNFMREASVLALPALVLAGMTCITNARAATWEYQGMTSSSSACFYDKDSLVRPSANVVRTWTKCISQPKIVKALEHASPALEAQMNDVIGKRIKAKDTPGFVLIPSVKKTFKPYSTSPNAADATEVAMQVLMDEFFANFGQLKENSVARQEFDCVNRTTRLLALTLFDEAGNVKSSKNSLNLQASEIAPDSPAEWLMALICPAH